MEKHMNYNPADASSIEQYATNLVGNSFREIINTYGDQIDYTIPTAENEDALIQNLSNKGSLGQLIEKYFFHYENNNDSDPDFPEAGVELKVSCYRKTNKGELRAKERLILHMINYMTVVNEDFENSSLWHKIANILFVYYLYDANIKDRLDYRIDYTYMFTPPAEDLAIIKHDYEVIVDKIRQGKAHELSEGDTLYLGAATKAATSANRTQQPFSDIPAKPRAFSYKNSYMTYVLNTYILKQQEPAERILSSASNESLKQYVERRLRPYYGYCVDDILTKLNIEITSNPKHLYALLAYRMLGIKGNQAEEFIKANIVVKAIRIEATGTIKESISFPAFSFQELANEEWDESEFRTTLCERTFLFVVYKFNEYGIPSFIGSQFWNMPIKEIDEEARIVWERAREVVRNGVQLEVHNGRRKNNFPKQAENRVAHVRPHGRNAADTDTLPNGEEFTKQCFWLNRKYIMSQLDPSFFE